MSIETRRRDADGSDTDGSDADEAADAPADRNEVAVHFANGTAANYAVVVRQAGADWLLAERLVGDGEGFDEEEVESINADHVRRVRSECVYRFDGGVVHHGSGLLVDPETLLDERWLGGR